MKRPTDTWVLVGLFIVLLVGGYILTSPANNIESKAPTSYNADPSGTRAFYVLLKRLGYSTGRLRVSYSEIPKNAKVLIVVQPGKRSTGSGQKIGREIDSSEIGPLIDWVNNGGTVIFFADKLQNIPIGFRRSRKIGRGSIQAYADGGVITNRSLRKPGNAKRVIDFISSRVSEGGLVLFDEYHHGLDGGQKPDIVISRQVKISIWILAGCGVLLIYSTGRRFGAIRPISKSEGIRPAFEFVESVARLYRRAGASDLAAEIMIESFKRGLCAKLKLPGDASDDEILSSVPEIYIGRVSKIFDSGMHYSAGNKPADSELLDLTVEIRSLERVMGIGANDG